MCPRGLLLSFSLCLPASIWLQFHISLMLGTSHGTLEPQAGLRVGKLLVPRGEAHTTPPILPATLGEPLGLLGTRLVAQPQPHRAGDAVYLGLQS